MNANDYQKLVKEKFGADYPYDLISKESRKTRMAYLREKWNDNQAWLCE
ncbi:hypothetical protein [Coprobacillus cateniformis]